MKGITVTVKDKEGLHARPAGILAKAAKEQPCKVTIAKNGVSADMKKIFGIMKLAVKCGEEITITCDGEGEDAAIEAISQILKAEGSV